MESSVAEIHEYPASPEGYVEPLFRTRESDREIMDHYLDAPWLGRASEYAVAALGSGSGHVPAERREIRLERSGAGLRMVDSLRRTRRCAVSSGAVIRVLDRWREVRGWWDASGGTDLVVYRVELACGAVVDLARDRRAGRWLLVGIAD